jgi:lipid-binding SYLF domain-containing protein
MKVLALCCGLLLIAGSVRAAELSKDEVKRLESSARVISELRDAPDRGISEDLWSKAQCVVVIPSMKRAAFIIGGEYGSGVMSCRHGRGWTAPVFMRLGKGSLGLQIGASEVDLVLVAMNQHGVDKLLSDKVSLGADASVAAGPVGRSTAAATDAALKAELLAWSRASGLFAGIDLSGGVLEPDKHANVRAYGEGVSTHGIADGTTHVKAPAAAAALLAALRRDMRMSHVNPRP